MGAVFLRSWENCWRSTQGLLGDKSDLAGITGHRLERLSGGVNPVDTAQEPGLRIACVLEILVGFHDLARVDGVTL